MLRRIIGWRRTEDEEWAIIMRRMNERRKSAEELYKCEPWSEKATTQLMNIREIFIEII